MTDCMAPGHPLFIEPEGDFSTVQMRQKAWDRRIQEFLKSDNGLCDFELHLSISAMLKTFVGNRTLGLLFCAKNGNPLLQSNILRLSLHPNSWGIESIEVRCPGIYMVPHNLVEEASRARRLDSFLARPCE